ncbi:hypothetical protein EGN72_03230 [Pseudorhodobacter sp. E13]|uniref:hypothetical protein n=1 Tax=Pseudorhodobacter sp. E13 TaxID=2487931 RepID=UPI000F8F716F|nr:hypothetical protein [Pseudorhodobacter sp. E13]RUS63669.1 hypothetical protein EGN72_03230 [Pseudorhodobacter sp. E13]
MAKTPQSDRHELQGNLELLLDGDAKTATGRFDHLGWDMHAGGGETNWTSLIASLHETCHFELNQSTAYGALLMAQAYLMRELGGAKQLIRLEGLRDRCRNCHEIYATLQSLMIAQDAGVMRDAFVEAYLDYRDWLEQGEALIAGLHSRFARMAALAAVIKGCFQTPVLVYATQIGLEDYVVDDLPQDDFPDQRLAILTPMLTEDFWQTAVNDFLTQTEDDTAKALLTSAETAETSSREADQTLLGIEFEPFSVELSAFLETRIAQLVERAGQASLHSTDYVSYCQPLLDQCDALAPFKTATSTLRLPSSDKGSDTDALEAQLSETLVTGPPIPARVCLFDDLPRTDWDRFISRHEDREVIFVASRTKDRLKQQYDLDASAMQALEQIRQDYLVYMVKAVKRNGQHVMDICLFSKPGQLLIIDRILKKGILASTSMLLLSDKHWQEQWHDPIANAATQIILFDLSPLDHLERSLATLFADISYKKYRIEQGEIELACLVFAASAPNLTSIFVAPCSDAVANGIIRHVETDDRLNKSDSTSWSPDGPVFDQLSDAMPLLLSALFLHETRFDFKALQSEFGALGFEDGRFLTTE